MESPVHNLIEPLSRVGPKPTYSCFWFFGSVTYYETNIIQKLPHSLPPHAPPSILTKYTTQNNFIH